MSKLIAAARHRSETDPLLYLAGTAASATLGASVIVLAAFAFMVA